LTEQVTPGIVIPLVLLPVGLIALFAWYRRSIAAMRPDGTTPVVSGVRLTSECLHRLASTGTPGRWRVVYETAGALGAVDHVVIGPAGVAAIITSTTDRPPLDRVRALGGDGPLIKGAANARHPVDELLRPLGVACSVAAWVYWGTSDAQRPPGEMWVPGRAAVEGQRLGEWLGQWAAGAAPPLNDGTVEDLWRAVVTGIGRPDPITGSR
jgi:hypothetical protein